MVYHLPFYTEIIPYTLYTVTLHVNLYCRWNLDNFKIRWYDLFRLTLFLTAFLTIERIHLEDTNNSVKRIFSTEKIINTLTKFRLRQSTIPPSWRSLFFLLHKSEFQENRLVGMCMIDFQYSVCHILQPLCWPIPSIM